MATEQQIEEMAAILCGVSCGCDDCMFRKEHCGYENAKDLYNAGYRKQSEVIKQIFDEIAIYEKDFSTGDIDGRWFIHALDEMRKRYMENSND